MCAHGDVSLKREFLQSNEPNHIPGTAEFQPEF